MTSVIFNEWLVSFNNALSLQKKSILLLMDNAPSHHFIELSHIKLIFLPPNMTSVFQPCDAGIIKSFKSQYRKLQLQRIINMIESNSSTKIELSDAIRMCNFAWNNVSQNTIRNSWRHTNIIPRNTVSVDEVYSALDGNIFTKIQNYFGITDLLTEEEFCAVDNFEETERLCNDEDILRLVYHDEDQEDDRLSIDNESENCLQIQCSEAHIAYETVVKYFEQNGATKEDLKILTNLHSRLCELKNQKQSKITDFFVKK